MGFIEELEEIAFLGPEFVTWLVVSAVRGKGPSTWETCQPARVEPLGSIALEGVGEAASQVVLKGDNPEAASEMKAALSEGKSVQKVNLSVRLEEETWQGTLDAKTLEWRSVKLSVPTIADAGEFTLMRTEAFERLNGLLEEWFRAFLKLRLAPKEWSKEIEAIKTFSQKPSP